MKATLYMCVTDFKNIYGLGIHRIGPGRHNKPAFPSHTEPRPVKSRGSNITANASTLYSQVKNPCTFACKIVKYFIILFKRHFNISLKTKWKSSQFNYSNSMFPSKLENCKALFI